MIKKNRRLISLLYIGDLIVFLYLILAVGLHWFYALLLTETVLWLVRLIWINPTMLQFIFRRLLHMIPIILAVIGISFFLTYLAPGDIFTQMAMNPDVRPEDLEFYREQFGLNDPWYIQFFKYIWSVLHGNFGFSETFKAPVFTLVNQRLLNTLILSGVSMFFAWIFSIPAGIIAATKQYKIQDQVISVFAFLGLSIPNFFLAFLLLYLVSVTGSWLPIGGMYSLNVDTMNGWEKFIDLMKHLAIPAFVIATSITASLTRVMRANMLEILNQQYIITARAKGLNEFKVVYKHALKIAINPMITMFGFQLGGILGGSALVEIVCSWPGLGRMILAGLMAQDTYLVTGSLIYSVALLIIGNLFADIMLAIVDPRIRIG